MPRNTKTISARESARKAGKKTYVGNPCKNCGGTIRVVANGSCKPCALESAKRFKRRNKARMNADSRAWRQANSERACATTNIWKANNPERVRETRKRWEIENVEKRRAAHKAWREANRDLHRLRENNRRARIKNAPGSFKIWQVKAILVEQGGHCAYCDETENLHIDHVIPISRGGSNWPWNLQWLCAYHNISKNAKTDAEYRELMGFPKVNVHLSFLMWHPLLVASV